MNEQVTIRHHISFTILCDTMVQQWCSSSNSANQPQILSNSHSLKWICKLLLIYFIRNYHFK